VAFLDFCFEVEFGSAQIVSYIAIFVDIDNDFTAFDGIGNFRIADLWASGTN